MNKNLEKNLILLLIVLLVIIGMYGCSKNIGNCEVKPSAKIESDPRSSGKLDVIVSPKGEVACNF